MFDDIHMRTNVKLELQTCRNVQSSLKGYLAIIPNVTSSNISLNI